MEKNTKQQIDNFYAEKNIAIIGVSRDERKLSSSAMKDLIKRNYNIIPINPNAEKIQEIECIKSIKDVNPVPQSVLIMTPNNSLEALKDCIDMGIKNIWIYKTNEEVKKYCTENNIEIINDLCPYMVMPNTNGIHKFHGSLAKLFGSYPK